MAKHNFGVIKATFTNYMNESENLHAKDMFGKFMKLIKESKALRLQFNVYKNLENKYIPNENLAIKYIDENINLITKELSYSELIQSNKLLPSLIEGLQVKVSDTKKELYEYINTLIDQSLCIENRDVDKLHEAFTFVLEYIKNNKPTLIESASIGYNHIPKEFLVRKAIEKFNERFSSLNESDKKIFKSIISNDVLEKETIFENLKIETVTALKTLIGNSEYNDSEINESIKKTTNMQFNSETYSNDVLSLNELYTDLTQ